MGRFYDFSSQVIADCNLLEYAWSSSCVRSDAEGLAVFLGWSALVATAAPDLKLCFVPRDCVLGAREAGARAREDVPTSERGGGAAGAGLILKLWL